jgi:WD repeat and SOF domain-containing protein 1
MKGERTLREAAAAAKILADSPEGHQIDLREVTIREETESSGDGAIGEDDELDLSWSTVLKRTFEAYVRNERPNMYGEWLRW